MIRTVFTAQIFQIGAGLSVYIAELGSVFLCADLGIAPELEPRPDHASYLASWLKILSNDQRFIFSAAAHAQKAAAFLHGLQPSSSVEAMAA
jgi:antirestriction protein ArdC